MTHRHLPRPADLAPLLRPRRPQLGAAGRLARCFTVDDVRRAARRRAPRPVYEYVVGAAEREVSRDREAESWRRVEFHPRVLRDVSKVDLGVTVVGEPMPSPLILGPTGFSRMMHADGERAVVRAAAGAGVTYTLACRRRCPRPRSSTACAIRPGPSTCSPPTRPRSPRSPTGPGACRTWSTRYSTRR